MIYGLQLNQLSQHMHFETAGGGGQCTFCAVDFLDEESWQARSDYENQKLPKFPTSRLACLNNIQGPATIRVD